MAFTGTAVVELIAGDLVRITGLSLGISANGTIGLFGDATADENLPDNFNPVPYADVNLSDAIQVLVQQDGSGTPLATMMLTVAKAESPFQITITNLIATATGGLEIYVRYH
jgi:hypothetical protein